MRSAVGFSPVSAIIFVVVAAGAAAAVVFIVIFIAVFVVVGVSFLLWRRGFVRATSHQQHQR